MPPKFRQSYSLENGPGQAVIDAVF